MVCAMTAFVHAIEEHRFFIDTGCIVVQKGRDVSLNLYYFTLDLTWHVRDKIAQMHKLV